MNYKTIIITGSSKGLGAEIAREHCKRNYMYYGISRFNDLDITNYDLINNFFSNLNDMPIALINNAGTCLSGNIFEINLKDFEQQYMVNLFGLVNCCKGYANLCIENKFKGKIINIASTAGLNPRPGRSAYSSSKAAVINFSLSMSEELREYGIKVYTICPGAFDSQLRRDLKLDDDFEKMLKPDKVARFILSLIEDGDLLDGQIIKIIK